MIAATLTLSAALAGDPVQPTTQATPAQPPPQAVVAVARPMRPVRWRIEAAAATGMTVPDDRGYQVLSGDTTMWAIDLAIRSDFRLAGPWYLGGSVGYQPSFVPAGYGILGRLDTYTEIQEVPIGVRMSLNPIEGIDLYGQLEGGPSIYRVDLQGTYGYPGSNAHWLPTVQGTSGFFGAQLGTLLYMPRRWLPRKERSHVTAGIDLGVGYRHRFAVELKPDVVDEASGIEVESYPLGDVRLGGFRWSAGLFLRIM